jgi:hypothetical protein
MIPIGASVRMQKGHGRAMDAKPYLTGVPRGLLEPNIILPLQHFAPRSRLTPEHRLMIAVLQDAIECVAKYRDTKDCQGRRLFREATQWLLAEETDWPYSFKCICGVLDLDANAVRCAVGVLERPSVLVSPEIQNATHAYETGKRPLTSKEDNHDSTTENHSPCSSPVGVHARCGA